MAKVNHKKRFNVITTPTVITSKRKNLIELSPANLSNFDKKLVKQRHSNNKFDDKKPKKISLKNIFNTNKYSVNHYLTLLVLLSITQTFFIPFTTATTTSNNNKLNNNDLFSSNSIDSEPNDSSSNNEVEPCEACRLVVSSFEMGMDATSRGKHEGGDTSWEEKNLKNYADSEVRLVEIQEKLCEEVKKGKAQCLSLVEDTESEIENWWFNERKKNVRLNDYLCISKLKRCCPIGKYGPNCQACPSDCNEHGACDGAGTRTGTGKCNCDTGYVGQECDDCADDHFRIATNNANSFTCRECDLSCEGCFGPGPLNCTECRQGYHKHEISGCIDINECDIGLSGSGDTRLCKGNTYCENTDGGFKCTDCHVSCNSCVGYGPNMCLSCAPGYQLDEEYSCRSREELEKQERWEQDEAIKQGKGTLARYFFYVGILASSVMMFGLRSNLYVMYTFLIGFIVFLLLSELDILDEIQDYTLLSSE